MNSRMLAAILAIAALVALIYVFSPIPYLPSGTSPSAISPVYQILIPAAAVALIFVLIFVVPSPLQPLGRQSEESGPKSRTIEERRTKQISLLSGALAGFIAAWIITGLVLIGDSVVNLPPGTFYSVIGISMGFDKSAAMSVGVILHLVTGTIIGAVFGYITRAFELLKMESFGRAIMLGIFAGFLSFSALFIPITRFEVEPALAGILAEIYPELGEVELGNRVIDTMSAVLAGSVLLHLIFGCVLGTVTYVLSDRWRKILRAKTASHFESRA